MSENIEYCVTIESISKDELLQRMERKTNFVLVDTIGKYEGNKYKIKGATTIDYPTVIDRRKELAPYEEIIIYCTRKECVASKKVAAGLLLLKVPNVKVYEGGLEEWMSFDLPVEEV